MTIGIPAITFAMGFDAMIATIGVLCRLTDRWSSARCT